MMQDSRGFIWFGIMYGLVKRWDEYKTFRHDPAFFFNQQYVPVNTFQTVTEQLYTSVEEEPIIGFNYDLYQNYPNLFNPSMIIEFSLPEKS